MSKLPPLLTDPPCPDPDSRTTAALIAWAMAYGQQCYQQALEEVINMLMDEHTLSAPYHDYAAFYANKVRALKDKT